MLTNRETAWILGVCHGKAGNFMVKTARKLARMLLAGMPPAASPQTDPVKTMRILTEFIAGSGGDIGVRLIAAPMSKAIPTPQRARSRGLRPCAF